MHTTEYSIPADLQKHKTFSKQLVDCSCGLHKILQFSTITAGIQLQCARFATQNISTVGLLDFIFAISQIVV